MTKIHNGQTFLFGEAVPELKRGALVFDYFAGAGGASTGIEQALGRSPDVAINHCPNAVACHKLNHPNTDHYQVDVWDVDPKRHLPPGDVEMAWFSPNCQHFSRAKGGKPVSKKIRGLAWVVVRVARERKPRVVFLENVAEFATWGPLDADGMPVKAKAGQTFRAFVRKLEGLGYAVEHRVLNAADYGAPTLRKRLVMIARRDGKPIVWPDATHGPGRAHPYRTAAECIDWTIPVPSIFDRPRPLADATCKRLADGIMRYVVNAQRPFIAPVGDGFLAHTMKVKEGKKTDGINDSDDGGCSHGHPQRGCGRQGLESGHEEERKGRAETNASQGRAHDEARLPRGSCLDHGSAVPGDSAPTCLDGASRSHPARFGHQPYRWEEDEQPSIEPGTGDTVGEYPSLIPRGFAIKEKHRGRVGAAGEGAEVGGQELRRNCPGFGCDKNNGLQRIQMAAAFLTKFYGTSVGAGVDAPAPTITGQGQHIGLVAAFLTKYYSSSNNGQPLTEPMHTVVTKDRFGLVTVLIDGETYAIVDIGLRMLTPRELARAQGFEDSFQLVGTQTEQVARIGNSVSPPMVRAVVAANI